MNHGLDLQTLAAMNASVAILGVGRYALPVRFRVKGRAVECPVPTWSGVGDLLEQPGEVTLVTIEETPSGLRWLFLRGLATVLTDPDWEGLRPPAKRPLDPSDLYHLLRIEPKRLELVDEQRGWGARETADL
ncbi:MAG: hypothetical protein ACM3RP_14040 [Chitinophagales bacterium]